MTAFVKAIGGKSVTECFVVVKGSVLRQHGNDVPATGLSSNNIKHGGLTSDNEDGVDI